MDLSSYADLAVRLVNTTSLGHEGGDQLVTLDGLRALVADREHLNHDVTRRDLEELRGLREEFRAFFTACANGDGPDAADRLNSLLIQQPVRHLPGRSLPGRVHRRQRGREQALLLAPVRRPRGRHPLLDAALC
jgi:hypothetical protein